MTPSADHDPTHLTVHLVRLPTRAALAAAHERDPQAFRELVIVKAHQPGDDGAGRGWGECSALNTAGYTTEWAANSYAVLTGLGVINPATHPMTAAAVEMAQLDWRLRHQGQSLSEQLGTAGMTAKAGAVIGLNTIPAMLAEVGELVSDGFERIKCKVVPGRLVEPVRALCTDFPDIELVLDANGSLSADDLASLISLRDLGVTGVEQPFAPGDHQTAQRLVAESDLAVIADEAIAGPADMWALAQDQAATAVAIKPPRLGGLATTLQLLDEIQLAGMGATIGGMIESGLGRHVLGALAPLAGFTITGDLSPAGRWIAEDPFADVSLVAGQIGAPSTIGIAGDPDVDLLDRFTVDQQVVLMPAIAT